MTNMHELHALFNRKFCDGNHDHVAAQGSEGGERRSVWAQRYPPALCEHAVDAFEAFATEHAVAEAMSSPYTMPSPDESPAGSSC